MDIEKDTIIIYCDGACSGNPGPGGWGAVLLWREHKKEISGFEGHTTNNRMELMAAIMALSEIKKPLKVELYTDSKYLRDGITTWIKSWQRTQWKQGKVKNCDLWQRLLEVSAGKDISWHWVKGHSGNYWNEVADKLATGAIDSSVDRVKILGSGQ